jgi:hypothetical protein
MIRESTFQLPCSAQFLIIYTTCISIAATTSIMRKLSHTLLTTVTSFALVSLIINDSKYDVGDSTSTFPCKP